MAGIVIWNVRLLAFRLRSRAGGEEMLTALLQDCTTPATGGTRLGLIVSSDKQTALAWKTQLSSFEKLFKENDARLAGLAAVMVTPPGVMTETPVTPAPVLAPALAQSQSQPHHLRRRRLQPWHINYTIFDLEFVSGCVKRHFKTCLYNLCTFHVLFK